MAACFCCWLGAAEAEADGGIELVEAVPMMTGNSDETTEAGTPPELKAPATDEVSSDGLNKLGVGITDVVIPVDDPTLRMLVASTEDGTADMLEEAAIENDCDVAVVIGAPFDQGEV